MNLQTKRALYSTLDHVVELLIACVLAYFKLTEWLVVWVLVVLIFVIYAQGVYLSMALTVIQHITEMRLECFRTKLGVTDEELEGANRKIMDTLSPRERRDFNETWARMFKKW